MFNAPCCETCTHISIEPSSSETNGVSVCLLHGKKLPIWLPQWKSELVIWSRWRHYRSADSIERVNLAFPNAAILYNYPNEYSSQKNEIGRIDELPNHIPAMPLPPRSSP